MSSVSGERNYFPVLESISIINAYEKLKAKKKKNSSAYKFSGDFVVTETDEHMCPSTILEFTE